MDGQTKRSVRILPGPLPLNGFPFSAPFSDAAPMSRSIQQIEWKRSSATAYTDITGAIEEGLVSATPHPDPEIEQPKGYSVPLTLKPESTNLAHELQEALLDVDPIRLNLRLQKIDEPITELPVSVSKVPHPGDQNTAELGVPPRGHDKLHEYF